MATATKTNRRKRNGSSCIEKNFCEFFAGIGLVREGLATSGWRCVYANDNDPKKQELYEARFGAEDFHFEDVNKSELVLATIEEQPFLATASFPCIDLSLAGHWRGLSGKHSSVFFGFADVVAKMGPRKPKVVMIENVNGFLTSRDGEDFASVATALAELGYFLDAFVIDAKWFVPQSRPRVFVVGVHESVVDDTTFVRQTDDLFDSWTNVINSSPSVRPPRLVRLMEKISLSTAWIATPITQPPATREHLREFIDVDDAQDWWDAEQVEKHHVMMSDLHRSLVDELRQDEQGIHVGTIYRRQRYGEMRAEVRFDGMAGCLRVPRGGSARQIVIVIDKGELRIRWMSPREYARLQGVPDFPLVGRPHQQMAGFGDAVCVPVIEWIDKCVLTPIYESTVV